MKRFVLLTIGLLTLTLAAVRADDISEEEAVQITGNCGEIRNRNFSQQVGSHLWLEYTVETSRNVTIDCPWLTVSVEGWVSDVPGSGGVKTDMFSASLTRSVPVPYEGHFNVTGRHYRNYLWWYSFHNGTTSSTVDVRIRPDTEGYGGQCGEDPDTPCEAASSNGGDSASPIIVDVERDGYRLTSLDDGVFFDLDADGVAELVSWTREDSDDAFLALDRNGNGKIDDGTELFGNFTPVFLSGAPVTAANGFEALRFLEGPAYGQSSRDEIIDEHDAAYARLLLWTDRNHDGVSQPGELKRLRRAGLQAIETEYKLSKRVDRFGNEFRQRGKALWSDGKTFIFDVWLRRRP